MNLLLTIKVTVQDRFGWSDPIEDFLPGLDDLEDIIASALDFELSFPSKYLDR